MSAAPSLGRADRHDDRWMYRTGARCALTIGLGYVVIFVLYARVGAPPTGDGEAWLAYLRGKTGTWWTILGLSVLTDVLFLPVALALYDALRRVHHGAMQLAAILISLFVVLDLAVTWTSYAALLTLAARQAAAATDAQRTAYVTAAHAASAMLTSPLLVVYAIVALSSGILNAGPAARIP